ncbi:MAG: ABC transporter ATP-binding protein [Acidobacteria bacterium]|nr:MAG: ABC transporter ATP-binding protein [Acidobacteriota bacterium]
MTDETAVGAATAESPPASIGGEVLIEVEHLSKHYGPIRAVDDVSFTVRRGDVLGFLGPNGAGKTTAMRLITGFLEPDAGRVRVAGFDLATDSLRARQRIGYLPENAPAYGEMTVSGFLDFIAQARAIEDAPRAIARVIERTGLSRVKHQTIDTLSKGFKRRVGLAQALIHDPEVLILDEPTDGLDPNQKVLVHKLIDELAADRCIVLSTHILDEVERICNRAMIISQGKILVDSTPEALIARAPSHNVIRLSLYQESPALLDRIRQEPWCDRLALRSPLLVDVYPQGGENHLAELLEVIKEAPISSIHLQEGRLDDVFRDITEGVAA